MKANSLVLTLGLALATTYGLGQTGSQGGQYPSSQSPTTQQQPSTEQARSNTADQSGQQTPTDKPVGQSASPRQDQQGAQSGNNAQVSDETLERQVHDQLATEPSLKNIQVETKNG